MTLSLRGLILLLCATVLMKPEGNAAPGPEGKLEAFFKSYLDEHFRLRPTEATQLGEHRYDHLLEDLSRTFSEVGVNIIEARCTTKHPMVKNRFVVEVGDTSQLKQAITRLRQVDSVFDAYRVTPGG